MNNNDKIMKSWFSLILVLSTLFFTGCGKDDETVTPMACQQFGSIIESKSKINGKIYKVGDFWLLDVVVNDKIIRCSPCNLPDELKIENKSIVLDADFYQIPPNVRMAGNPIEITKIY